MRSLPAIAVDRVPAHEAAAWRAVGAGWRQLHGSFHERGFSLEWHDFESKEPIDWARSFHPESVELCLNLAGRGRVRVGKAVAEFNGVSAGFYRQARAPLEAVREGGQHHQFITVELAPSFLSKFLGGYLENLHPLIRAAAEGTTQQSGVSAPAAMTLRQRELVASLRQPPVLASAQALWFEAKALELMGEFFFVANSEAELFCHRQQRVARNRVEAVIAILKRDLCQVPTLESIAREVGCSPFYLSRTFSKEMKQTIPQYLRQIRMEKAAMLLRTGDYNVTEVAFEVGYSSLSHFSQAFHQAFGCCPGLYPLETVTQRVAKNDPSGQ